MWEMGYSKDPESSSESWCPWIFTEQSSLPFFTFTFVFIFFANLPAHPAWAWASAGGGGAGEAPLICFQDACSLGPGTELHAQGTGERNLNLELSPCGEQETRNKVERVQFASLRSPVDLHGRKKHAAWNPLQAGPVPVPEHTECRPANWLCPPALGPVPAFSLCSPCNLAEWSFSNFCLATLNGFSGCCAVFHF